MNIIQQSYRFAQCCYEMRIKEIWNASHSQKPFSSSFISNISPAAENMNVNNQVNQSNTH